MLTQKIVDAAPLTKSGRSYLKDPETPGLTLVLGMTKKSWRYQRDVKGKAVALVLDGAHTLKEARAWALEQKVLIGRGHDPQAKPEPPKKGPGDWTVRKLMETRLAYMEGNGYSAAAIYDFKSSMRYLTLVPDLMTTLVRDLKKTQCGDAHRAISIKGIDKPAPVQANRAMDYLSASWRYAKDKLDDHYTMPPDNPTKGADRNPVGKVQASIDDLQSWNETVGHLPNPVRRHMHRIGLLTGLRWTTLRCLEKDWINGNRLTIPPHAIKARRGAVLPLSGALIDEIRAATAASDFVCPGSRYLFPSKKGHVVTDDDRPLIKLGWPGKLRRKTYYTHAGLIGCPDNIRSVLMDHAAPGLKGNYQHAAEMFDDLLKWQEQISARLLSLMK